MARDEIEEEVLSDVDRELDAWEGFYRRYKEDYDRIAEYERRIETLEGELRRRESLLKQKLEEERGTLIGLTVAFAVVALILLQALSSTANPWLHFIAGLLLGLGSFSLLYLWTR